MNRASALIKQQWKTHAPLTLFSLLMTGFTLFLIVGIFADSRTILGQPAWLKPAKFGLSITAYTISLTWLLGTIRPTRRWVQAIVKVVVWVIITVFTVEMIAITIQAARGTTSHFNFATTDRKSVV